MLDIRDLSVSYGKHQALDGASLHVNMGEIVVILGANGAGKSTLLKAMSGICEGQTSGSVTLDGHTISGLKPDRIVEEGIALVPEGRGIFGDLTVEENLKLGAFPERARDEEQANLDRVYALFPKLTERRKQIARTMSGGEQQMVAIGRAMMSSPQILTLDEPSLGLSPLLCKELFQNLSAVRELGIGILMVEQNAKQSLAIADRGYLLENTRIIHEGRAEALMTDPAVQAAYLGGGGKAAAPVITKATDTVHQQPKPSKAVIPSQRKPRQTADSLVGFDVSDLVAKAGQSAASERTAHQPSSGATSGSKTSLTSATKAGELGAMLKEFEIAAARAGRSSPLPSYQKPGSRSAETVSPANPKTEKPVTIEIYRAPRVEVYRRKPSTGAFEKE
ncbi:MAG: ABC transporter ATP-binding protein [Pelagimonas sp.]|uniref:ABC transporter ATP-binding protein n=1 Tax=Pelagimonas sp. TaxID=2073170 RepID=UPI003D6A88FB